MPPARHNRTARQRRTRTAALTVAALAACAAAQLGGLPAASAAGQQAARQHPAGVPAGRPVRSSPAALYSWGYNPRGELGNGTIRQDTSTPGLVHLPATFTPLAAAAGANFAFSAGTGNTVYAWGDNLHGQLGNGKQGAIPSPEPVKVQWPAAVTPAVVTAGDSSAYVIGRDGRLYDWGNNKSGQLGIGSTRSSVVPVRVKLPGDAIPVAVAGGENSAYAVASGGAVYAWGSNSSGQLGNRSLTPSTTPVQVQLPAGVGATAVAAGQSMAYALTTSGTIYAWGDNAKGQLGTNQASSFGSLVPIQVQLPGTVTATAISAGRTTGYALGSDGAVYAWGDNELGQLGSGQGGMSKTPVKVPLPGGFTPAQITGGAISAYAADASGQVYGWGNNSFGQLGTTPLSRILPPVRAGLPAGVTPVMLVPEPMSGSGFALTGQSGLTGGDYSKTGKVTYLVGGPGPTVHIEGGGGGTSNCTNDETNKTNMAYADPTYTSVSFTVKDSGSCGSEASWSYFTMTVTGRDSEGHVMNASGRFWFGQNSAGDPFYLRCAEPLVHMTCSATNPAQVIMSAFPG
jgi:alpha-tubulin suppressor-like RCC1 family protein